VHCAEGKATEKEGNHNPTEITSSNNTVEEKMKKFESIVVNAARNGLRKLLGDSPAATIEFYCDSSILAKDPFRYQNELEKMFGVGAKVLGEAVLDDLHLQLGKRRLKRMRRRIFAAEILKIQKEYHSKLSNINNKKVDTERSDLSGVV
jgi:hypothetical protein